MLLPLIFVLCDLLNVNVFPPQCKQTPTLLEPIPPCELRWKKRSVLPVQYVFLCPSWASLHTVSNSSWATWFPHWPSCTVTTDITHPGGELPHVRSVDLSLLFSSMTARTPALCCVWRRTRVAAPQQDEPEFPGQTVKTFKIKNNWSVVTGCSFFI